MASAFRRVALVIAIVACGETLPQAESPDAGPTGGDAGNDAVGAGDAADADADAGASLDLVTKEIVAPWHLAVAGNDLVVTSHGPTGGGVFRVAKTGGPVLRIGFRPAYGVAVRGLDDVWFCNAGDAGGPGLVQAAFDAGGNQEHTSDRCRNVAVEPNGAIAYTAETNGWRFLEDGGVKVYLGGGADLEGIAADIAGVGVYFADRPGNEIDWWKNGSGAGNFTSTGAGPTNLRADSSYVYWVESGTPFVRRRTTAVVGSNEIVSEGPANAGEGGLALDETHVYWIISQGPSAGLYRAPKTFGPSEAIKTGLKGPIDVVLDADYAYVTVHDENQVVRIPKN
jgi:hypothetical protein